MKPTEKQVEKAIDLLKNAGYIMDGIWSIKDVKSVADDYDYDLTEDECFEVIDMIQNDFDANIGINWDVILDAIHKVKPNIS